MNNGMAGHEDYWRGFYMILRLNLLKRTISALKRREYMRREGNQALDLAVGDIVRMKKPHPCGGYEWEVLRTGMDFRIKCLKCAHMVMLPRVKFEKGIKKIISNKNNES